MLRAAPFARAEEGNGRRSRSCNSIPAGSSARGSNCRFLTMGPATRLHFLSAAIALPGCLVSFVSATGLILTNHHCLFSLIQEHTTPI